MRRLLLLLCAFGLGACASAPKKADEAARLGSARVLRQAIENGRVQGAADPAYTPMLEDAALAWLLYRGPAPMAGARRLLDLEERGPSKELAEAFLTAPEASGLKALTEEEDFRNGQFFNSYDAALFRPFFRHALLRTLQAPAMDEAGFVKEMEPLELALRLTPRFGGVYPNQLSKELRAEIEGWLKSHDGSDAADRFRLLLLWDQRNGAWEGERARIDKAMNSMAEQSQDELLKLDVQDAMAAPHAEPGRAFWMSLLLPGLGQVTHGDVQGGILLGGLTLSAWVWMGSKLAQAPGLDDAGRQVAYGDAAWAAALALMGHGFTALNAAEQARYINIVVEWDLLSKDRLQVGLR